MFFFSSRRRHTRLQGDWSSDVCSSDLDVGQGRAESRPRLAALLVGLLAARIRLSDHSDAPLPRRARSEERRVGKEGRSRWSPYHLKKKKIGRASCRERV